MERQYEILIHKIDTLARGINLDYGLPTHNSFFLQKACELVKEWAEHQVERLND